MCTRQPVETQTEHAAHALCGMQSGGRQLPFPVLYSYMKLQPFLAHLPLPPPLFFSSPPFPFTFTFLFFSLEPFKTSSMVIYIFQLGGCLSFSPDLTYPEESALGMHHHRRHHQHWAREPPFSLPTLHAHTHKARFTPSKKPPPPTPHTHTHTQSRCPLTRAQALLRGHQLLRRIVLVAGGPFEALVDPLFFFFLLFSLSPVSLSRLPPSLFSFDRRVGNA